MRFRIGPMRRWVGCSTCVLHTVSDDPGAVLMCSRDVATVSAGPRSGVGGAMTTQPQVPTRLASEDVIMSAPMSYAGSAQRIFRLRRQAHTQGSLAAITALVILLLL